MAAQVAEQIVVKNREDWLTKAAEAMANWFVEIDREVPPMRVSVGWPGGRAKKNVTVGQCWPTTAAEDGVAQIFLSPVRGAADTVNVLGTLLHEMIHAVDDCASGHAKDFIVMARSLGFEAKWTSSDNRTEDLTERLTALAEILGEFPSAAIVSGRAADSPKTQSTRMLKVVCQDEGSEFKVRMTRKMIDEVGFPICPCHDAEMELATA